jgi:hypothetical protein
VSNGGDEAVPSGRNGLNALLAILTVPSPELSGTCSRPKYTGALQEGQRSKNGPPQLQHRASID